MEEEEREREREAEGIIPSHFTLAGRRHSFSSSTGSQNHHNHTPQPQLSTTHTPLHHHTTTPHHHTPRTERSNCFKPLHLLIAPPLPLSSRCQLSILTAWPRNKAVRGGTNLRWEGLVTLLRHAPLTLSCLPKLKENWEILVTDYLCGKSCIFCMFVFCSVVKTECDTIFEVVGCIINLFSIFCFVNRIEYKR